MNRNVLLGGCVLALVAAPKLMKMVALILLVTMTVGNTGCLGFLAAILGAIVNVVGGIVSTIGPLLMGGIKLATGIVGAVAGAQGKQTTNTGDMGVNTNTGTETKKSVQSNEKAAIDGNSLGFTKTNDANPDTKKKVVTQLEPVPAQ